MPARLHGRTASRKWGRAIQLDISAPACFDHQDGRSRALIGTSFWRGPNGKSTKFVEEAKLLEDAGASLLDFTNSGPVVGAAVAAAVSIPVIEGSGGPCWMGRMRMAHAESDTAASPPGPLVSRTMQWGQHRLRCMAAYVEDVRAGVRSKGAAPAKPP